MNFTSIWKQSKKEIKSKIPDHAYSTWVDPIKLIGFNDNVLRLEVPNQFFFNWIQSHYHSLFISTFSNLSNLNIDIKYTVSPVQKLNKDTLHLSDSDDKHKTKLVDNNLNVKYNFSSFIKGDHNQFARAAAISVSENPGTDSFNPLVIYGGVGMGKTHLLHAIGNKINNEFSKKKVVCASSEKFTLDFISSIQKSKTVEFSNSYRSADVLLIDDIQFFQGKEQTQEQFFHTFNELFQSGKQIVMTADRYPGDMKGLQDRLLSRFKSGLSVDIQPPDYETRIAIIMEKAEKNGVNLSYDIIELIGTHIKNSVRDLESTIIRLLAHSSLSNTEINYGLAKKVVKERVGMKALSDLTVEQIIKKVSEITQISEKDIIGKSRRMPIVEARQISIYLCREILKIPLSTIGIYFGGRDHTTIIHACNCIKNKIKNEKKVYQLVKQLNNQLSFAID